MKLEIKKDGDSILREPTNQVENFDFDLQELIESMVETMRSEKGVGLAAPQVGKSSKVIVLEFQDEEDEEGYNFPLTILCNPEIIKSSKKECQMVEGCLSVPGREILIKRPCQVTVAGQDRYGKPITIEADKLQARVLQHEIDHLNQTLITDHMKEIKVIFIGTGSLGVPALKALIADPQYKIVAVITGKDERTKVRGKTVLTNEIFKIAKSAKLNIIQTDNVKNEQFLAKMKQLKPQVGVMADFGQIIPEELISIPKFGIINIHPSLLPRHRGASPIQSTILSGDEEGGVTLMLTAKTMDAGPVIAQSKVKLSGGETSSILKEYLAKMGAGLLLSVLPYYLSGEIQPVTQDESQATYTKMIEKEDGLVGSETPAVEVERKVRAYDVWPKVSTEVSGKRVQITAAHFDPEGNLVIDRVKPECKAEMSYADFELGYKTKLTFEG